MSISREDKLEIAQLTVSMLLPQLRAVDGGLMNRREAAAYLRMSIRGFHRAVADGKIRKARGEGKAVFDKTSLDLFKFTGGEVRKETRGRKPKPSTVSA